MKIENLKLKIVLIPTLLVIIFVGFFVYEWLRFNDGKLHLVFCRVGQGDAIFMRTPSGLDILTDGGPDDSVLSCLSSHMPFWDRTIELVFLTHPHADHMRGLLPVFKRYKVLNFSTEKLENDTVLYTNIKSQISNLKLPINYLYAGDKFRTRDGVKFEILGPSRDYILRTSSSGFIDEKEFASLIILLKYKETDVILTGDSQIAGLKDAIQSLSSIDVLQIPHHGSRFGLDQEIVQKINPKLAVISVGKNTYGHPSKEVIEILRDSDIKVLRTDINGEIHLKF